MPGGQPTKKKYKKKENGKNDTGRPETEINKTIFENLCEIQCTKEDICNVLDCDEKTITKFCKEIYGESFSDTYKKKSAIGKSSLRRSQMTMAKTIPTMAIWLGKQYLGQRDKHDLEHSGNIAVTIIDDIK